MLGHSRIHVGSSQKAAVITRQRWSVSDGTWFDLPVRHKVVISIEEAVEILSAKVAERTVVLL